MLPRCASVLCQGHDMLRSEHDGRLQSAIGGINGDRSHTSNRRSRSDTRILEHYLRRLPVPLCAGQRRLPVPLCAGQSSVARVHQAGGDRCSQGARVSFVKETTCYVVSLQSAIGGIHGGRSHISQIVYRAA